ncbi:MAG: DNA/RNA nuclease SfsA [Sediminispirochaetaceae bacterium]
MNIFSNDLAGRFIERPNRFLVIVDTPRGIVQAHCPNPGRLQELLIPGTPVILERAALAVPGRIPGRHTGRNTDRSGRKTDWTLAAAEYRGQTIPLISVRANRAAEQLILPRLFPDAQRIQPEYSTGDGSRFDFMIEKKDGSRALVEVKSCTLAAHGRAMFPDAPTVRGLRHVEHLAAIARGCSNHAGSAGRIEGSQGFAGAAGRAWAPDGFAGSIEGHLIFVLHHPDVEVFTPNIHTDPAFSLGLEAAARDIQLHAFSLDCGVSGECRIAAEDIPFDFRPLEHVRRDRGVYLLLLELNEEAEIDAGSLGRLRFPAGSYLYAGSAKKNLSHRTARHLRRGRKKLRWHIDYLRETAARARVYPVFTDRDLECELASRLRDMGGLGVTGFGSSDCRCESHLFYFPDSPAKSRIFQDLLLEYRHGRI